VVSLAIVPARWFLISLVVMANAGAAEPVELLRAFARGQAVVETRRQCLFLDVYLPQDAAQRAQGLMFIRELGEFEGMLFATPQPAQVQMWMKNTFIPLDMIFVREDMRVAGIAASTATLSEELIRSPGPVSGVLEVNGGFAERHGVAPGDTVTLLRLPARP
jgi:uncharacterized membrane protein (UPF0127 family)